MKTRLQLLAFIIGFSTFLSAQNNSPQYNLLPAPTKYKQSHLNAGTISMQKTTSSTNGGKINYTQLIYSLYSANMAANFISTFPDSSTYVTYSSSSTENINTHAIGAVYDLEFGGFTPHFTSQDSVSIDTVYVSGIYFLIDPTYTSDKIRVTIIRSKDSTATQNGFGGVYWLPGTFPNLNPSDTPTMVNFNYQGSANQGVSGGLTSTKKITYEYLLSATDTGGPKEFKIPTPGLYMEGDELLGIYIEYIPTPGSYLPGDTIDLTNETGDFNLWRSLTFTNSAGSTADPNAYLLEFNNMTQTNTSQFLFTNTRYSKHSGINAWRNDYTDVNPYWGHDIGIYARLIATQCLGVSNLYVSNITNSSATLNWTGETSHDFYIIEYQSSNSTIVHQDTSTLDSFNIYGLSPDSVYCFKVSAVCNLTGDTTNFSNAICFSPCGDKSLPFTETFDDHSWIAGSGDTIMDDQLNNCWSRTPNVPNMYSWNVNSGATTTNMTGPSQDVSGNGNYMYVESSVAQPGNLAILTLPSIDISTINNVLFVKYAYHFYGANSGILFLEYKNGNNWDVIDTISGQQHNASAAAWKHQLKDLSGLSLGSTLELRFKAVSIGCCTGDIAIDEIRIFDSINSCPIANNLAILTNSCDSINITWVSDTSTISSALLYGTTGFNPLNGGTLINGVSSPYTIKGLTPGGSYDIYILDSCSIAQSVPSKKLTVTIATTPKPLNQLSIQVLNTTNNYAEVEFDASATNASSFLWFFGNGDTSTSAKAQTLYGNNGVYFVQLQTENGCGVSDTSFSYEVKGISIDEELTELIKIYPNPTSGTINITDPNNEVNEVSVFDMSGKQLSIVLLREGNSKRVNLEGLAKGVYLLRIKTVQTEIVKQVILE